MTEKLNAHRYVLAAGHRNTTRGGAPGEIDWTPGATRALAAGLRAVGAEVFLVTEHDGDGDADFTHQPLWAVGRVAVAIAKKYGDLTAYLSMHYGGEPVRGFFAIPPDAGGLVSAASGAAVHDDGFANNPLDVKLARAIAARVKTTGTIPLRNSTEPGVMSERATGVGGSGWRLSELQETRPIQPTTARLILEAGNILTPADAAYIRNGDWVRSVYVPAIVAGLRDVFGAFPLDGQKPKPQPVAQIVSRNVPQWLEWSDENNADAVTLSDGTVFYPLQRNWMTAKDTPVYQYGTRDSAQLTDGEGKALTIPAKRAIAGAFIFRSKPDGDWWVISDAGGRIPMSALVNPFDFLATA